MSRFFLALLFFSNLLFTWGQTSPDSTLYAEIPKVADTVFLSKKKTIETYQYSVNDTLHPTRTTVEPTVISSNSEIISNTSAAVLIVPNLYDNVELAAIDARWMDLVKQTDLYDSSSYHLDMISLEDYIIDDLSTEILKQRLEIIDAKTPFHVNYHPDLERLIKRFLVNRKDVLSNLMAKAKYFFPIFEEKLDKYDIPLEMKYLAIVESALRPKARSRVGATGLWQFMYPTGKQYGLDVNSYVDERQDPILATEAACRYLADLYNIFNDWDLALAAYNSGPGNVNKAIRRSGGYKNYWNIRNYLPRETASYVPIFYATLYLFEYAEDHNLQASADFNLHHFEVDSVQIRQLITFEQIQAKTGIDESLLEFLNPAYKLNIIPHIKNKNYSLVLPSEYMGIFVQNEEAIYAYAKEEEAKREKPRPEVITANQRIRYRVRSGDYLGRIAERHGVSVSKLKRWNNLKSSKLRVGQRLTIYPRNFSTSLTQKKKTTIKKVKKPLPKGEFVTYTVKEGDSLWSISKQFSNVSVSELKDWNSIWGNKLTIGTSLKVFKQ